MKDQVDEKVHLKFVHARRENFERQIRPGYSAKRYLSTWTRTWDNCLENKASGCVMTVEDGSNVPLLKCVNAAGDKIQKWRLDPKGRMLNKASNLVLCYNGNGVVALKRWGEGDRETWKFRCLDQTKTRDTFVNFTPWQNLVSWD